MTHINQTQEPTSSLISIAIDAVDARTLAHHVISDLSAIFEALEKLEHKNLRNKRIARMLSIAGVRHAEHWLKIVDKKIVDASNTLDGLKSPAE